MHNTMITHLVSVSYKSDEPLCDYDKSAIESTLQLVLEDHIDALTPINLTIQAYNVEVKPLHQPAQPPVPSGHAIPPALGSKLLAVLESVQTVLRSDDPAIADTICVWNTSEPLVVPVEAAIAAYKAQTTLCQQPACSPSVNQAAQSKWQMMPLSATRKMIDAAERVEEDGYDAMYQAMRVAAPQPPSSEPALIAPAETPNDDESPDDYWGEDDKHPLNDWKYEVENGDTRAGYWQWVKSRREQEG